MWLRTLSPTLYSLVFLCVSMYPDLKDLYQGKPISTSGHEEPSISLTLSQFRYLHIILIYSRLEHTWGAEDHVALSHCSEIREELTRCPIKRYFCKLRLELCKVRSLVVIKWCNHYHRQTKYVIEYVFFYNHIIWIHQSPVGVSHNTPGSGSGSGCDKLGPGLLRLKAPRPRLRHCCGGLRAWDSVSDTVEAVIMSMSGQPGSEWHWHGHLDKCKELIR